MRKKQIKEEYREGYVSTFTPENVIRQYEMGNNHLRYDFKITQDGSRYFWMRIDAYIFFSQEDECIHMFTYRKNINAEKEKEIRASFDEMTGFLNKMETGREITALLSRPPDGVYAFFLFDMIILSRPMIRAGTHLEITVSESLLLSSESIFRVNDVLGRVGGDEFAAFIPAPDS